jgi:hypothetical protein
MTLVNHMPADGLVFVYRRRKPVRKLKTLCREALIRTDVSKELSASFIRVTRNGELGTTLAVTSSRLLVEASVVPSSPILATLIMEALRSSETSVLTIATRRNIPP